MVRVTLDNGNVILFEKFDGLQFHPATEEEGIQELSASYEIVGIIKSGSIELHSAPLVGPEAIRTIEFLP